MATKVNLTANNIKSMVASYKNGATAQELAEKFEISTSTVLRKLTDAGVKIRSRGRRPSDG